MKEVFYTFDDIILTPQYSTLRSRSEADTSFKFWKYERSIPIISANMETVTGSKMAIALWKLGAIGSLHRFWTVEENVKAYEEIAEEECDCIVSVGVGENGAERAEALFNAGARMFVVDIAHGHSVMMKETVELLKDKWGDEIFLIGGNIATGYAAKDLYDWGCDCVKVGVGQGSICTTRVVTGHGVPSFSAIQDVAYWSRNNEKLMIADGGMKNSGDIVKALVAGADCVMLGSLLAGTDETPGDKILENGKMQKLFKGSSSYERKNIAKEGIETTIEYKGLVEPVMLDLVAGVRSGMSYSNAKDLSDLRKNGSYNIQTMAGYSEGLPHILNQKVTKYG